MSHMVKNSVFFPTYFPVNFETYALYVLNINITKLVILRYFSVNCNNFCEQYAT